MADIVTWTTPTVTEVVYGVDISDLDLYMTIEQKSPSGSIRARLTSDAEGTFDGTDTYVTASFTQQQTGQLHKGKAVVMVNAVGDDARYATEPLFVTVVENAVPEEVTQDE